MRKTAPLAGHIQLLFIRIWLIKWATDNAATWRGPYLKKASGLIDPWGRPYRYRHPGRYAAAEVYTLGRDNAPGGTGENQDLGSW